MTNTQTEISLTTTDLFVVPMSREEFFAHAEKPVEQWNPGNAVLLLASNFSPKMVAGLASKGLIQQGIHISACSEAITTLLEAWEVPWCSYDESFTLALLTSHQMMVLAERLVVQRLMLEEGAE